MYELGSIVRNGGEDFLTYMYKGKYYCCRIDNVGGSNDDSFGVGKLEEIKSDCTAIFDHETQLNCCGLVEGKAKRGEIYNKMLLCKKKKGKLVWVSLKELQMCDLNTLLHIKGNYYKPGDESNMNKYEIVEVY
jgi:hypothetical protein